MKKRYGLTKLYKERKKISNNVDKEIDEEKDVDLDMISNADLYDLLLLRSSEIGYHNALIEFYEKDWLNADFIERKLKGGSYFADELEKELIEKNIFRPKDGKKEEKRSVGLFMVAEKVLEKIEKEKKYRNILDND